MRWLVVVALVAACGHRATSTTTTAAPERDLPPDEQVLALLPEGAQVVVEVDLERLGANAAIGKVVERVLAGDVPGTDAPLDKAERVLLAAYGVGTTQAATVTLVVAKTEVPHARRVAALGESGVWALGPPDWVDQLEQRAALAAAKGAHLHPPAELLALRGKAMPAAAPGASLRVTARLPFDARVSLARMTGIDSPPAQLSAWGDVVDDLAVVVLADASDAGGARAKQKRSEVTRLEAGLRGALASVADVPTVRALGLVPALADARISAQGSWVRLVVTVGPKHLGRVIERANAMLDEATKSP